MSEVFWKSKFCGDWHMISRRKFGKANKTYLKCKHCRKWNLVQKKTLKQQRQRRIKHSKKRLQKINNVKICFCKE